MLELSALFWVVSGEQAGVLSATRPAEPVIFMLEALADAFPDAILCRKRTDG